METVNLHDQESSIMKSRACEVYTNPLLASVVDYGIIIINVRVLVVELTVRERVTVTTGHISTPSPTPNEPPTQGTIRTEEYKRDLAEFQARRSGGSKDLQETPIKKKCGRHSLPVSCTDCTGDPDTTFNYEKKSAMKYKKKTQNKRSRNAHSEEKVYGGVPNVQFLFQNQVFMPGNMFGASYSEPRRTKHCHRQRSPEFLVQKQIDFKDDQPPSPPFIYKNNSLRFNAKEFISDHEEVDGVNAAGDVKESSQSSGSQKNDSCEEKLWEVMSELKHFDQWADEQLQGQSLNTSKSDDSKSDTSAFGLPIASACNLNVTIEKSKTWSHGRWGVVPVQLKRLAGVTVDHVRKKQCMEINILRFHVIPQSDTSAFGLPIASACNLNVTIEKSKTWSHGRWGVVPVQLKRLAGVTVDHVRKKQCMEINILRKCRHPNIILLMGLYPDVQNNIHIICERCNDSLFGILHVQGRILSAQTSVHYALDIANALVFLRMQGFLHTELSSMSVMITAHDTAKLADVGPCVKIQAKKKQRKGYEDYSPEPQYVNLTAVLPWKSLSYDKLKELYTLWKIGVTLPQDGTYPGSLLSLLQQGLMLKRDKRIDLASLQSTLQAVQKKSCPINNRNLDNTNLSVKNLNK
ncbi:jg1942 [Pararge aegeria aegeria]|uniref:Jg1942 protein n=1 Tax=Pararge aegeria aegeria TaxID=348720 RepID=A0A8S4R5G3_9NEOP|nr:jg1942 [Pararge aegeria aegeria]